MIWLAAQGGNCRNPTVVPQGFHARSINPLNPAISKAKYLWQIFWPASSGLPIECVGAKPPRLSPENLYQVAGNRCGHVPFHGCHVEVTRAPGLRCGSCPRVQSLQTGAAWLADKKVIPVCYGNLSKDALPHPYSAIQALNLQSEAYYLVKSVNHQLNLKPMWGAEK
jgi:hypothetical protein